ERRDLHVVYVLRASFDGRTRWTRRLFTGARFVSGNSRGWIAGERQDGGALWKGDGRRLRLRGRRRRSGSRDLAVEPGRNRGDANFSLHGRLVDRAEDDFGVVSDGVV